MTGDLSEHIEQAIAEARALPRCGVCGKHSDAGMTPFPGHPLCGTCRDLWAASPERQRPEGCPVQVRFTWWLDRARGEAQNGLRLSKVNATAMRR